MYDLTDKETKEKYGVKNINELTKPQIRKYKIDRARLFKGIEQYMYLHEDITISSNVNEVIRAVLNSLYIFFFAKRFSTHQKYQKHQKHKSKKTQSSKSTNAISEQKLKMRLKKV